MTLRHLQTPSGETITVGVFDSVGGNLYLVFRDKVMVLDQGDVDVTDRLALAAWESARD